MKDRLYTIIKSWKNSDYITYTRGGNLNPPTNPVLGLWIGDSCKAVSVSKIQNSIKYAEFSGVANDWHIAKHDVYVTQLLEA